MAKIENLERLNAKFRAMAASATAEARKSVVVGYSQSYAVYVHELEDMVLQGKPRGRNHGNFWDPPGRGQAKFLEQPAREIVGNGEGGRIAVEVWRRTRSLVQAMLAVAYRIQRESQLIVPVDTGALKSSAFVEVEG